MKINRTKLPDRSVRQLKKIVLVMKLSWAIILILCLHSGATVWSQGTDINLKKNLTSLQELFTTIEDQTGYRFFYNNDEVDVSQKVVVNTFNKSVGDILNQAFDGLPYSFREMENKLILVERASENSTVPGSQQPRKITGKVVDSSGVPLPGVSVVIKETTKGVITDSFGNYTITGVAQGSTLAFSFVGMRTQEITVSNQVTINVKLEEETIGLEEVVAVGYGTVKKSDLTGSVASVSAERLLDKPAFNVAQAISGKIAGVKIVERSGAPGGRPMIRIRGTNSINSENSPLVVVDGIVGVSNALDIMNPNEIASIEVLKDASATAIYGARGANGVILITTKRGYTGKIEVEYDGSVSVGILQKHLESLNAEEFLYVLTQSWKNIDKYSSRPNWPLCVDGSLLPEGEGGDTYSEMPYLFEKTTPEGYAVPLIGRDGNYYKPRFDTDWEKEIFRPSVSNNHQLSIRGGNQNAKVGTFIGYSNEDGLLLNSYFHRYTGKITGDFIVNKWLDISSSINVVKSQERVNDVSYFSGGISRGVTEAFPIIPLKYPNDPEIYGEHAGRFGRNADFPVGEVDVQSPYEVTETTERITNRIQFTGNLTFNFKITKDLSLKTNFAADEYSHKYNEYGGISVSRGDHGRAFIEARTTSYWQNENYFNYNKVVGDHSLSGLLGASWSRYKWEEEEVWNNHFFDDFYKWHNIGVGTASRPSPSSEDGQNSLNSYFARLNYSYMNKYLFTFTSRVDGSSKFGADSKYGFFPSGSVAWRISEEDFSKQLTALSNLKLRLSVGQTGNQEIGSYVTQGFIGSANVALGGVVYPGLYPRSMANPKLKWEKTTQYDGGIDAGFFDNRISIVLDYYYKKTTDMLLSVPLPTSTTTGSVRQNYGEVENKGLEIILNTHVLRSRDLNWYTDIAWSANKNKILKLGPTGEDILRNYWVGGANTVLREGESLATFWGLNRLGTYSTEEASLAARYGFVPGDVKYEDKNNDGAINASDGYLLGNAFPKWDMDFNNRIEYKNFDLSLDIRISYGAKMENRTNHSGEDRQTMGNSKATVLDAWRPDHQNSDIGQVRPGMGGAYYQTYPDTHWIEDASYIRGDGLTLGYTLPKVMLDRWGVQRLRLFLTAKNFFVITDYSGYDPEGSDSGNMDSITPHMDFYQYPRPSTFTFGVNVLF